MAAAPSPDLTEQLRSLMQAVEITSFKELARRAEVSEWQVRQLRQGRAEAMRVEYLYRLSRVLNVALTEILHRFSALLIERSSSSSSAPAPDALQEEYRRLEVKLSEQRELLWREFQHTSLQTLESWLIQFPTAAYAAQNNPQVPATRLLPLMRPVEQLLKEWQVEAIASVGTEIPYDPYHHQLMEGTAHPGQIVRVRYTGYKQGDRLLHRAKVSPV